MSTRGAALAALVTMALVVAACSGSASFSIGGKSLDEAAEELIGDELAQQIGLGQLTPDCPELDEPEVGVTFVCTATTADGLTVEFAGVVDRVDHIKVEATNLVSGPQIEQRFYEALDALDPDAGLTPDEVDCGGEVIVLVDEQLTCEVRSQSAAAQKATLTVTDITTGEFDYTFE